MKNRHTEQALRVEPGFGFFFCLSLFLALDGSGMGGRCLAAVVLHELGHLAVLKLLGIRVNQIRLKPCGIEIRRAAAPSLGAELVVNLAGPLTNLLLAAGSARLGWLSFSAVNCALGLFELCPLPLLDGGQALMNLMQRHFPLSTAERICARVQWVCFALMTIAGLVLLGHGANFTLILLLAGLALMSAGKTGG